MVAVQALLCGRDVCGGQLADVMWIPQGNYALFPVFIPGKPNIPSEAPSGFYPCDHLQA